MTDPKLHEIRRPQEHAIGTVELGAAFQPHGQRPLQVLHGLDEQHRRSVLPWGGRDDQRLVDLVGQRLEVVESEG